MSLLQKLKQNIRLWSEYHNPYHYWWKARKWFKRPKAHFVCGKFDGYFGFPCRTDYYYGKPKLCLTGLGWKSKYDSPRHEWDPAFALIWTSPFKTIKNTEFTESGKLEYYKQYWIGFIWNWNKGKDWRDDSRTSSMATWEAILDVVIWNKRPETIWRRHIWKSGVNEDAHTITIKNNMKIWKN